MAFQGNRRIRDESENEKLFEKPDTASQQGGEREAKSEDGMALRKRRKRREGVKRRGLRAEPLFCDD